MRAKPKARRRGSTRAPRRMREKAAAVFDRRGGREQRPAHARKGRPGGTTHATLRCVALPRTTCYPHLARECSSMVEPLPSKQATRVRFPSLAPFPRRLRFRSRWRARSVALTVQFASPAWRPRRRTILQSARTGRCDNHSHRIGSLPPWIDSSSPSDSLLRNWFGRPVNRPAHAVQDRLDEGVQNRRILRFRAAHEVV